MAPNFPSVMEGEPKEPEKFDRYAVGEYTIFINRNIVFNRTEVLIDIRRFMFAQEMFIEGVDIAY